MSDRDRELPDVPSSSEDVTPSTGGERLPEARPEPGDVEVVTPAEAPHAARFQFLLGALAAIALVAVAAAALALTSSGGGGSGTVQEWSAWQPEDDSIEDGAEEIAQHVAPRYKMTGGAQLVAVDGGPLTYDDPGAGSVPMKVAMLEPEAEGGEIVYPKGDAVLYRLCGLGENCTINRGTPSRSRHLLLRREALELALYSFRYLDDVDQVVVFLPPGRSLGKDGKPRDEFVPQAMHFERGDVEQALTRPLDETITPEVPTIRGMRDAPDATAVQSITGPNLFGMRLEPANGQAEIFVVLEPLAAPSPTPVPGVDGSTRQD